MTQRMDDLLAKFAEDGMMWFDTEQEAADLTVYARERGYRCYFAPHANGRWEVWRLYNVQVMPQA